jgi:DNA-binding beta-propeller fold protein YncE
VKFVQILFIFAITAVILTVGCSEDSPNIPPPDNKNGFQTEAVAKVFADNCTSSGCHAGNSPAGGLSIENLSELLKGVSNRSNGLIPNYGGESIIPFRLDESLLYQILLGNVSPITPHDAISLSQAETDTIKNWLMNGARDNNNNLPYPNPTYRVYVCNQNSDKISVIDGDVKVVSAIIDVNQPSLQPSNPHMVKVRDGFLYATLINAGKFLKINTNDYSLAGEISGITKAGMIVIHPDGNKAFISRSSTSNPVFQSIYAININNMSLIEEITIAAPGVPHGMALTPDGSKLYVANLSLSRISIVDGNTNEYGNYNDIVLPNGTEPMQTMISPDGNYLYISARGTAKLLVYDTNTDTLVTEVPVDMMPMQITSSSSGDKIYVGSMMMSTVNVIQKNGNNWARIKQISHPGFNMIHGCDITADDKYVFVSSRNTNGNFKPYFEVVNEGPPGTIGIIDTEIDEVVKLIEIEQFGSGLVVEK